MSKLTVYDAAGTVVRECELDRERIRIGRGPENEISLDDLSVSNEHALVTTIRNDSFIQDLNSMNGVRVNGRLVKHHHLQDGDEISIAPFTLKYAYQAWVMPEHHSLKAPHSEQLRQATIQAVAPEGEGETLFKVDVSSDLALSRDIADTQVQGPAQPPVDSPTTILMEPRAAGMGFIRLVAGPGAGREAQLARPVTTLGKPGIQTAVISRRSSGYFLTYVEGSSYPQVNGMEVGATPHPLQDHDIIDLAGTRLEFVCR
jgi:pSer/pThr/pTyr-binding forkhead associated (FHA) protein